jgi:sulfoxide reductase heme-binding subunit YedZ
MTTVLGAAGPSAYWYLTRSTGAVSLLLLSLSVVLGVVDVQRFSTARWPRFVLDALHRNVSLLVVVFLSLHIITAALDSFAAIPLIDSIVPFIGSYRAIWLGLGALAFDLLLAITITSMLRQRIGHRTWRTVHWLAYASWPLALVHTLGTGSDVKSGWLLALSAICLLAVLGAIVVRATRGWPARAGVRGGALAGTAVMLIVLFAWLPGGPLGKGWSKRAGTPTALLAASSPSSSSAPAGKAEGAHSGETPASGPLISPFEAKISGTISERSASEGLITVRFTTTFSGSPSGTLLIEIVGQPVSGGGVQLSSSSVTLGSTPAATVFRGRLSSLEGTQMSASVEGGGRRLALNIMLNPNLGGGRVSGAFSSAPAR